MKTTHPIQAHQAALLLQRMAAKFRAAGLVLVFGDCVVCPEPELDLSTYMTPRPPDAEHILPMAEQRARLQAATAKILTVSEVAAAVANRDLWERTYIFNIKEDGVRIALHRMRVETRDLLLVSACVWEPKRAMARLREKFGRPESWKPTPTDYKNWLEHVVTDLVGDTLLAQVDFRVTGPTRNHHWAYLDPGPL